MGWSGAGAWLALVAAALAYIASAFVVAPGFYDGLQPAKPYNWLDPPPQFRAGNKPPQAGHATLKTVKGVVDPGFAFTDDGQCTLSVVPGSFAPPADGGPVTIDIVPAPDAPPPRGFKIVGNPYRVTASAPLIKEAAITLTYPDQLPAPSVIYFAASAGDGWTPLSGTGTVQPFAISARTTQLGYFVAGYPPGAYLSGGSRFGAAQALPIFVAFLVVVALLGGLPLALLRRRRETSQGESNGEEPEQPPSGGPGKPDQHR